MSMSPRNILQRLRDLKVWQENHEELLRKTKNFNITSNSDFESIDGLSEFDGSDGSVSVLSKTDIQESDVILPKRRSFMELLEEKLSEDVAPVQEVVKPKRQFLRKGSGLKKYKSMSSPVVSTKPKAPTLKAPNLSLQTRAQWSPIPQHSIQDQGEQTLYEQALEKELLIFEALEDKAKNSSFCSTNSSVLRIFESTPTKLKTQSEQKHVHWETPEENDEIIETSLEPAEVFRQLRKITESIGTSTDMDSRSTGSSASSLTESTAEDDDDDTIRMHDVGVETEEICCPHCGAGKEDYEDKLRELIDDRNKIKTTRRNLDLQQRNFNKKKEEFEEEKESLLRELELERRALQKERNVFQSYMKESQNKSLKKDREQMSNLKQEIENLKETLKLKESKNGMTQARLRNNIKQLERENCNLKDEVEKLTKDLAKKAAMQKYKKRSEETVLKEINKNISKLTEETLRNKKEIREQELVEETEVVVAPKKKEEIAPDGSKQIKYPNGNVKIISRDETLITVKYYNGDIKETNQRLGTVKYFFNADKIWQITHSDGTEILEYPSGMKEKRFPDGKCEVSLNDQILRTTFPDGLEETNYADGTKLQITVEGEKTLLLPNGQKEIETKDFKRREYPDGTVKILYPDGTQETRYQNGRIRIKDKNGTLLLDTS